MRSATRLRLGNTFMPEKNSNEDNARPKHARKNRSLRKTEASGNHFAASYESLFSFHYTRPGVPAGLAHAFVLG